MPTAGILSLIGVWTVIAGTGLISSLFLTNPAMIGPFGVTLWFVCLLATLTGAVTLALYTSKSFLHVHSMTKARLRYSSRQAFLIGGGATVLLALGSLRQTNLRDALLLILILVLVELYLRLRRP